MELAGQDVLVLGLGVSGCSAARFCDERGARVVAADERPLRPVCSTPAVRPRPPVGLCHLAAISFGILAT